MAAPNISTTLSRRTFLAALAGAPAYLPRLLQAEARRSSFRFSVLSLFHPQSVLLHNPNTAALACEPANQAAFRITPGATLKLSRSGESVLAGDTMTASLQLAACSFELEVPGKLRRLYRGALRIESVTGALRCLVDVESELAVSSIVAAESPPHAPAAALAAQAVAARSFLYGSHHAHSGFDFCDTTHCQFLREPPATGSAAVIATAQTRGLVLHAASRNDSEPFVLAAMYSRSCGGRTHTLAELGLPHAPYPYYAVVCEYCRKHPETWQREVEPYKSGERARLDFNRIHGWSALPSNTSVPGADHQLHGRGIGHGIGLCQLGAADMAARGVAFDSILAHYYPNTHLAA